MLSLRLLTFQADSTSPSSQRSSSIRTKVTEELATGNDHSDRSQAPLDMA